MADEETPVQFPTFFENLPPGMREMYQNAWAGGDDSAAPLLMNVASAPIPGGPMRGAFTVAPPDDEEVTDGDV